MKVLLVIAATLFLVRAERGWDQPSFNRTQWADFEVNRTQAQLRNGSEWRIQSLNQALNRSRQQDSNREGRLQGLNISSWNGTDGPRFNRTQLLLGKINLTQAQPWNRTQWQAQPWNRTQWESQPWNRTQWQSQPWNSTQWQSGPWNRTQPWSRPRRASYDPFNQSTANGDVILGRIGYLDRLLFNQTYLKENRWWSGREKYVEYPKDLPGKTGWNRHENITAIRIYNRFYDGLESEAKIKSGGIGYRYVKIKLSAPWNRGFHYNVQIFGH